MVQSRLYLEQGSLNARPSHDKATLFFLAEAHALNMALDTVRNVPLNILTDSASSLFALEAGRTSHPWIQRIEETALNQNLQEIPIPAMDALKEVKRTVRLRKDHL